MSTVHCPRGNSFVIFDGSNNLAKPFFTGAHAQDYRQENKKCSLHQGAMIEALLLVVVWSNFLSRLCSIALLLHAHGYFVRLLRCLPTVVERAIILQIAVHGPPPREATIYSRRVMQYILAHDRRLQRQSSRQQGRRMEAFLVEGCSRAKVGRWCLF